MKGVVFAEFTDWIEQRHGVLVLDQILLDAELPHGGAFTSAGSYDWDEMTSMLASTERHLDTAPAALLRDYGRHLFGVFVRRYPDLLYGAADPFELLTRIESLIHPEVAKLDHDAELPRFAVAQRKNGITLEYDSPRSTAEMARGLIEGCFEHFGAAADIRLSSEGPRHRLVVEQQEGLCRSTT